MKKFIAIFALAAAVFASCNKNQVKTFTVTVTLAPEAVDGVTTPESFDVTLTNTSTLATVTLKSENNKAVFTEVLSGVYNITASAKASKGGSAYIYSGAANNVSVLEDVTQNVSVSATKSSALIFKEIYYTGAPGDNYYFRDQFYEIYNQSDATVYADGLCIAETVFANYDYTTFYAWDIPSPEKYVFCQVIWQMPGNGTDYPIKPGESFVVAQWAVDHRASELSAGNSVVDLSGAEFEAVTGETTTWTGLVLTDNAAINMNKAVNAAGYDMPQWLTSVSGSTYIIFNPSTPLRNENFILADNGYTEALEVALTDILDGVQAGADETRASTLGLPVSVDAGFKYCSDSYSGQSIARKKTGTTADGRPIFQDTNNTTDDFEIFDTPTIRRYGVGRPSWNTWAK